MKTLLILAVGLSATLATPTDGARDFELGLDDARRMMAVGRWGPAKRHLHDLLEEHRDASYAHAQAPVLREMLGRCALWERFPEPDPSKLIGGEVLDWDRASGRIRLRYRGDVLPRQDFERLGAFALHPLEFVGAYKVELRGQVPAADATGTAPTPSIAVAVQDKEMLLVESGHAAVTTGNGLLEAAPRILRAEASGAGTVLAEATGSPARPGAQYVLRIDVDGRGVRATWNGRALVSMRSAKLARGRVAIRGLPGLGELVLSGYADSAWLAGRIDAATQPLRARFRNEVKESEYVPAWLLAGPQRSENPEDADARQAGDSEPLSRLPGLLDAGQFTAAARAVQEARANGVGGGELAGLEALLTKALRGPVWPRTWTYRSHRYEIRSDVGPGTCEAIAATLEETTLALQRVLGAVDGLTRVAERRRVFVFSSPDGYRAYTEELGVRSPENAAGLYSPALKQLLLLHLGDRDVLEATARHENVHLYLDARLRSCPTWLEEGLAEYFETLRLERGHVIDGNANREHIELLSDSSFAWRPLTEIVDLDHASFYADGERCYAESWALVHFLARAEEAPQGRLRELVADLAAGSSARASVERHLGKLLPEVDARVRAHLATL